MPASPPPLLLVQDLVVDYASAGGPVRAVDGVDLSVAPGQCLGVVGESGCGKTTVALAVMRLLPPHAQVTRGKVVLNGTDLLGLDESAMQRQRGAAVAMVFQDALSALNPVRTVGAQVTESLRLHHGIGARQARERAIELLRLLEVPDPDVRVDHFPHHLSGGMRQRVMLAMALACEPALLLADEPTSALDVTVQSRVLTFIRSHQQRTHMAVVLISHDLAVVARLAQDVMVMFAGQVVEQGAVDVLLSAPGHPYTQALLDCLPALPPADERKPLPVVAPAPQSSGREMSGCRYRLRCPRAQPRCQQDEPCLEEHAAGHHVRCHNPCVPRQVRP